MKDFHSFQHGFITTLTQAGVESMMLKQVSGHALTGVTYSVYFKGYTPEQLYDGVLSKLDYSVLMS